MLAGCKSNHLALHIKLRISKCVPRHNLEQKRTPRSSPDCNAIRASKDSINNFHTRFTEVLTKENLRKINDENKNDYIDKVCEKFIDTAE